MLRKLFYITFMAVVLAGCQTADKNSTSNTPQEALEQLHTEEGFAEVVKMYRTLEIDNNKVISVYKGILDGAEEIFVAKLNKEKDDTWTVTDAMGIGMPSEENIGESIKTPSFEAGFTKKNSAPSPNTKLVQTDDKKYRVWVKEIE
ncbi:hypothetical protein CSV72_04085 [Sporosarcina sp. P20a]|uniref:hypothetical protein n=1 Tax=Sporosarcina sp. P20a TaxID=2048256 RepID=UPI000C170DAA|nr:hypothetical protein [Sporosarcina sp. P20a]PIC87163.1 hypothetical protein CSV72_04085 [Sporosarcina sp. P20a]